MLFCIAAALSFTHRLAISHLDMDKSSTPSQQYQQHHSHPHSQPPSPTRPRKLFSRRHSAFSSKHDPANRNDSVVSGSNKGIDHVARMIFSNDTTRTVNPVSSTTAPRPSRFLHTRRHESFDYPRELSSLPTPPSSHHQTQFSTSKRTPLPPSGDSHSPCPEQQNQNRNSNSGNSSSSSTDSAGTMSSSGEDSGDSRETGETSPCGSSRSSMCDDDAPSSSNTTPTDREGQGQQRSGEPKMSTMTTISGAGAGDTDRDRQERPRASMRLGQALVQAQAPRPATSNVNNNNDANASCSSLTNNDNTSHTTNDSNTNLNTRTNTNLNSNSIMIPPTPTSRPNSYFPLPEPPTILPCSPSSSLPSELLPSSSSSSNPYVSNADGLQSSSPTSSSASASAPYRPFLSRGPPPEDSWIAVETAEAEYRLVVRLPGFRWDGITLATRRKRILHLVADSWEANGGHFERRVAFGYDADLAHVRAQFDGEMLKVIVPRKSPFGPQTQTRTSFERPGMGSSASSVMSEVGAGV